MIFFKINSIKSNLIKQCPWTLWFSQPLIKSHSIIQSTKRLKNYLNRFALYDHYSYNDWSRTISYKNNGFFIKREFCVTIIEFFDQYYHITLSHKEDFFGIKAIFVTQYYTIDGFDGIMEFIEQLNKGYKIKSNE